MLLLFYSLLAPGAARHGSILVATAGREPRSLAHDRDVGGAANPHKNGASGRNATSLFSKARKIEAGTLVALAYKLRQIGL